MSDLVSNEGYALAYRVVPERLDPGLRELLARALAAHPYLAVAFSRASGADYDVDEQLLRWQP